MLNFSISKDITTLEHLNMFFDSLIELDDDDILFASSYIRGFVEVAAVDFGDEEQVLSQPLYDLVTNQLIIAKGELSKQDAEIVDSFWQKIKVIF
ncbi:YfcL family protein [Thalassotalea crassostreae]|uniref:YfcL family protein n=1 Tax=Thalassotalea crassostreae TaxID=1763536 RepID=UPI000839AAC0|nr:YfcL family protein [Thalassotalea crassostreae]